MLRVGRMEGVLRTSAGCPCRCMDQRFSELGSVLHHVPHSDHPVPHMHAGKDDADASGGSMSQDGSLALSLSKLLALARELRALASGCILLLRHSEPAASSPEAIVVTASVDPDRAEAIKECARLMAVVGLAEQRVLGSEPLYRALCVEAARLGPEVGGSSSGEDKHGALPSRAILELIARMRQEGYHPEHGGNTYSVILTREEKLQKLAQLR